MADHDYMANPDAEFFDNLSSGEGLGPDALHEVAADWGALGGKVADRVARLSLMLGSEGAGQVGGSNDWWTGTGGDAHRDETTRYNNYVQSSKDDAEKYVNHIKELADGTAEAKSTAGQPMGALFGSGSNPSEATRAVARATQKLYYNPGTPVAEELHYPGQAPEVSSSEDFVPPPKQAEQPQPSSGGGPSSSGGAAQHESVAPSAAAKPQQDEAASSQQPEAKSEGKPSSEGQGSGGGSGGGSGSGDSGKGSGSGAGGGSPSGGSPAGGSPVSGSGFDPTESGATHAMGASDWTPSSSSAGGSGLGGGVGTLGGDHERALSTKTGVGGFAAPKSTVNVNGLAGSGAAQNAGMGGGMGGMGGAGAGQSSGKEHKTPDYLKGEDNGYELFGGNLPVVIPEVIGELNKDEYQKMLEAQAKQQGGGPGGA